MRIADYAVTGDAALLTTTGLGSCVAIALHDADAGVGGLAHVLLPSVSLVRDRGNRAKFAGTAVPLLLDEMRALGAEPERVRAKLAGGACMFAPLLPANGIPMGERNVLAARQALADARIPLVGEDVGGEHGRSVFFHLPDGRLVVTSLRHGHVVL